MTSILSHVDGESSKERFSQNEDIEKLENEEGITVWGRNQETLEQQALRELEIFASESKEGHLSCDENSNKKLEEGEICDETESISNIKPNTLDIEDYIKRQKELKKIQEYKKTLEVSNRSKDVANRVAEKNLTGGKRRKSVGEKRGRKRKKSETKVSADEINDGSEELAKYKKLSNETVVAEEQTDLGTQQPKKRKKTESEQTQGSDEQNDHSGSEYVPSDDSDYVPENDVDLYDHPKSTQSKRKRKSSVSSDRPDRVRDDGMIENYEARLEKYYKQIEQTTSTSIDDVEDNAPDYHSIKGGLKVPRKIWENLYRYQKDGIKWLWEIHQKCTGGLLGDEMGLGKTVQIIAFLAALDYSRTISKHGRYTGLGPTIIVCPATVILQWVKHFHEWIPEFRVAVLHQSGSYPGKKISLIREIHKCKGILVTTYLGVLKYKGDLTELDWHYVILDEGHKVRNSTAKVTVAVKQFRTPHRLLLTGCPMQNNLQELWSLFDFTNPGMLGTTQTFVEHFANPIIHGGFVNATPIQEATALSMATALKNIITPYLLRRSKNEVQGDILLPAKSEQVLFCSITDEQRDLYKGYLMSEHVNMILGRGSKNWYSENQIRANMLMAITTLRKICNHPDIYLCEGEDNVGLDEDDKPLEDRYGYYRRSGKMVVVSALLKIWKKQGHRVLLFSQGRAMVKIFESFLQQQGYKYLKMDGSTSVSSRQPLIDTFNQDSSHFVFLLTTRVGGLGVNLTGANRVIIFDPDWNPATDTQARERAWRIGQDRQVTIYRLLCAGTIEEKMYQRQVWKQLLSNKILLDPKTHQFFRNSDLHDLFSLQEQTGITNPETTNIFRDSRVKIQEKARESLAKKKKRSKKPQESKVEIEFSEEKLKAMRELAQQISKSLSQNKVEENPEKPKKTPYQVEIEEERKQKLEEKQKLKSLTPLELMIYNRKRAEPKDEVGNKFDDQDTPVSFEKALDISEKTAKVYHEIKSHKLRISESCDESRNNTDSDNVSKHNGESSKEGGSRKKKHKKSKHKNRVKVDTSGTVDGRQVAGLVKTEIKKCKREKLSKEDNQDNFVLEKLFTKKGVSGALQHDSVIKGNIAPNNIRIETEVQSRTDRALQALRKSRLDNWRW